VRTSTFDTCITDPSIDVNLEFLKKKLS